MLYSFSTYYKLILICDKIKTTIVKIIILGVINMKMKKGLLMIGTLALVAGSTSFGTVNADTDPLLNKQGTTDINFTAPQTGGLTLESVPSYKFDDVDLSKLINTYSTQGTDVYKVNNLTGDSKGYKIQAQVGDPLKNGASILPVSSLMVSAANGTADQATGGQLLGAASQDISKASAYVASGNANSNGELSSGAAQANLNLASTIGIKAGNYHGTIDYTLSSGTPDNL